jgi:hypothetical protein
MSHDPMVTLTRRGLRMLRAGLDGFSAEDVLTLEVMSRIKYGRASNIDDLVDGLIRYFGSAEDAVVALKSGQVHFKQVEVDGDDAPDAAPTGSSLTGRKCVFVSSDGQVSRCSRRNAG